MFSESVKKSAELINIPYSNFTWDNDNKMYKADLPNINGSLVGFIVKANNGAAVLGGFVNTSSKVCVFGVIPKTMISIDSSYTFTCTAVVS